MPLTPPAHHQPNLDETAPHASRNLAAGGLLALVNYAFNYVTAILLTTWLGPEGFGDYMVGVAMTTFLATPITLGLTKLALKILPVYVQEKNGPCTRAWCSADGLAYPCWGWSWPRPLPWPPSA